MVINDLIRFPSPEEIKKGLEIFNGGTNKIVILDSSAFYVPPLPDYGIKGIFGKSEILRLYTILRKKDFLSEESNPAECVMLLDRVISYYKDYRIKFSDFIRSNPNIFTIEDVTGELDMGWTAFKRSLRKSKRNWNRSEGLQRQLWLKKKEALKENDEYIKEIFRLAEYLTLKGRAFNEPFLRLFFPHLKVESTLFNILFGYIKYHRQEWIPQNARRDTDEKLVATAIYLSSLLRGEEVAIWSYDRHMPKEVKGFYLNLLNKPDDFLHMLNGSLSYERLRNININVYGRGENYLPRIYVSTRDLENKNSRYLL